MDKETKTKITTILENYLPPNTIDHLLPLFEVHPVLFKIVRPRKGKLGDFRISKGRQLQITVNNNLNPYAFLITTVHEFAHLLTWIQYGRKVKDHGREWKENFIRLMQPILQQNSLPSDIQQALNSSLTNVKASSCTDIQLMRTLQKYDPNEQATVALENLPKDAIFALNEKMFRKEHLRRTRYMCTELQTNKRYLIHRLARVTQQN